MAVETLDQNQHQSSQYIDFWNSVLVPKFIRWKHILIDGLTLHSEAIFPTLAVKPGDKVVDAGCGFGDTAIKLAQLVGPSGSVLAVDCCDAFLDFGRKDVAKAGVTNITFLDGDVQTYPFEPIHDFCFSRFGTQFFENPVAGLRNMRKSLKPGGVMTMIVWRGIKSVIGGLFLSALGCTQNTLDVSKFSPAQYLFTVTGITARHLFSTFSPFSKNPFEQPCRKASARSFL